MKSHLRNNMNEGFAKHNMNANLFGMCCSDDYSEEE